MSSSPSTPPPSIQITVAPSVVDTIFSRNHLSYVVSTQENLRSYMSEALGIDAAFLSRFSVHDLMSALEHTLHCRPLDVPTEVYLKSQRLWIMHKLLIRIGLRDQIQFLASVSSVPGADDELGKNSRNIQHIEAELISMLQGAAHHLQSYAYRAQKQRPPVVDTLDEVMNQLRKFRESNSEALLQEKQRLVDQRCRAIRWVSWVYMQDGGEAWLKKATPTELIELCNKHSSLP